MKRDSHCDPLLEKARNFVARNESAWPEITESLTGFIEKQSRIVDYWYSGNDIELFTDCKEALIHLIEATKIVFKDKKPIEEWLRTTWVDIPQLPVLIPLLRQKSLAGESKLDFYHRYTRCAHLLLDKLDQIIQANNIVNVTSSTNKKEELKILFTAATYFASGELDKGVDTINSALEKTIRVAFHIAFSLTYGPNYFDYLPEDIQEEITRSASRGMQALRRPLDQNLFYHLSRSEYAHLINEKTYWHKLF